jgi:predicted dehydrogenase
MIEMQKSTGLLAGVGYQWSFSKAVRQLKKDIQSGVLGKPYLILFA